MNSSRDLSRRLLKLYPVKLLKDTFDPDSSVQSDIIEEIVVNSSEQAIMDFACGHHNYTKQHVFLYRLNSAFNRNTLDVANFPFTIQNESVVGGGYRFRCLPAVDYSCVSCADGDHAANARNNIIEYLKSACFL